MAAMQICRGILGMITFVIFHVYCTLCQDIKDPSGQYRKIRIVREIEEQTHGLIALHLS